MSRVIEGKVPPAAPDGPRGWAYPQDRPNGIWVAGVDHKDLVTQLTSYRIANGIRLGNPEGDIETYYCKYFPSHCHEKHVTRRSAADVPISPQQTYQERIHQWVANRYSRAGALSYVTAPEAAQRARVCAECPNNRPWHSSCAPCNAKTEELAVIVKQNLRTVYDNRLFGCTAAFHDNKTAVQLDEKYLTHRKHYQLPNFCWMNKLAA